MGLKFAKVRDVKSPHRAGKKEAGIDFYVPNDFGGVTLRHGDSVLVPMGLVIKLPEVPDILKGTHEYMLEFKNKSGVGYKKGLTVGSCVIDTTYQGELHLNLHNNTETVFKPGENEYVDNNIMRIKAGENIIQGCLILVNTEEIEQMDKDTIFTEKTQRGTQSFGSGYKEK